jgi:murein DD-endopeptidase MepM/ murein hydrolase activator NlpD
MLASKTPTEMANRASMLGVVAGVGNATLARLEEGRADLEDAQYRLTAATAEKALALTSARSAVAARQAEEASAQAAAAQVTAEVAARQTAYAAALKAQQVDLAQYRTMISVSDHLSARIVEAAARLAKLPDPPKGTGQLDRPGRGVVTSPYGMRYHPILHYVKLHTGTDFAKADGIVYAADDGVVLITELNVAYGNMTVIGHGDDATGHGLSTLYAHQAAFFVKPGDHVKKGQPIGLIGATGYATGPHLHFEVRLDGKPVDPAPYLVGVPLPPVPTTLPPVVVLTTP